MQPTRSSTSTVPIEEWPTRDGSGFVSAKRFEFRLGSREVESLAVSPLLGWFPLVPLFEN